MISNGFNRYFLTFLSLSPMNLLDPRVSGPDTILDDPKLAFPSRSGSRFFTGGIPTPLKNMKVNWEDYSKYMEK